MGGVFLSGGDSGVFCGSPVGLLSIVSLGEPSEGRRYQKNKIVEIILKLIYIRRNGKFE